MIQRKDLHHNKPALEAFLALRMQQALNAVVLKEMDNGISNLRHEAAQLPEGESPNYDPDQIAEMASTIRERVRDRVRDTAEEITMLIMLECGINGTGGSKYYHSPFNFDETEGGFDAVYDRIKNASDSASTIEDDSCADAGDEGKFIIEMLADASADLEHLYNELIFPLATYCRMAGTMHERSSDEK